MYTCPTNLRKTGTGLIIIWLKLRYNVDTINSTCGTIIGEFNADISKKLVFGNIFLDFCNEYSFSIHDKDNLLIDTYTYVNSAWGTTSWLDHVMCTSDANDCITNISVLYGCIKSDHHPVSFSTNITSVRY